MDKSSSAERGLIIPIGISIFSIAGILIALSIVYLDKPEEPAPATPTLTPFRFIFLGTETLIPSPELETTPTEETFPEESEGTTLINTPQILFNTPQAEFSVTPGGAPTQVSNLPGSTPQASATVSPAALSVTERYDNTDPLLEFDGNWEAQTNVAGAYQGTLSVSTEIENDLIFSFTGRQFIIGYRGAPGLGNLLISIEDQEFQVSQSTGQEWVSPQLPDAEHFVIIVHESGASVNLDYVNVLSSE